MLYALLGAVIVLLSIKIFLLKQSLREIADGFENRMQDDTNTLIYVSSRDKDVCRLAGKINDQLRILRREHHRYTQGDTELKNAITNISHDLRTPLTAICGYLDLMKKTARPKQDAQYLAIIEERTDMMKQLTEELFRYSVILSENVTEDAETLSVGGVLEDSIMGYYAALQEKGITPTVEITEEKVERTVSRASLARIFTNLLNNAVKYSDGDLFISMDSSGKITFVNSAAGLTGVQIEHLFERFYTVEAARNSTGLGLSIARTLAERMGGSITAEYTDDKLCITVQV